jgi:hypothetical protein
VFNITSEWEILTTVMIVIILWLWVIFFYILLSSITIVDIAIQSVSPWASLLLGQKNRYNHNAGWLEYASSAVEAKGPWTNAWHKMIYEGSTGKWKW